MGGQTAAGAAWEAWVRDAGWVTTVVALADREVEPESGVNVEKEAFVGGGTLLTGSETVGWPGAEAGEVESWMLLSVRPAGAARGLRSSVEAVRRRRCLVDTG